MIAEYAPVCTGTSSRPTDLADVVCADPDLLALEFESLMAANYPDFADRRYPGHRGDPPACSTGACRPCGRLARCRGSRHRRSGTSRRTGTVTGPGSAGRLRPHPPEDKSAGGDALDKGPSGDQSPFTAHARLT
jgi:hypothetical protein